MAIGQGQAFGRYMPSEFREMGFEYHKAADDFARIASEVPEPPDAAGWSKLVDGLAKVTVRCNAGHSGKLYRCNGEIREDKNDRNA